jgi:hypothetical protein
MAEAPLPPLLPADDLRARALAACRAHVEKVLEGEYHLEPVESELEWSPTALRTQFEQQLVVWRACATFEVLLDEADRPVGFVDGDRWTGCAWAELPAGAAEALARGTGLVPEGLALAGEARGEKDCLELVFQDARRRPRLRARVNPARRAVISVEPLEEAQ